MSLCEDDELTLAVCAQATPEYVVPKSKARTIARATVLLEEVLRLFRVVLVVSEPRFRDNVILLLHGARKKANI
jgi:hypothetical protein